MADSIASDRWSEAKAYEAFMGRWSRAIAASFVQALGAPPAAHWLDVGCGTGALTQVIVARAAPASVTACDRSAEFVTFARTQQSDARVRFEVSDVSALPRRVSGFDVVASNLVLNFLPDPEAAVRAMIVATAPRGLVAACVWDYASGMQYLRTFWDAAQRLDPAAGRLDEGSRFPICSPVMLAALFEAAGLTDIATSDVVIETPFRDFADYWHPLLGGVGPAGTYVAALSATARDRLAHELERSLPRGADGSILLTAGAFVVRGRVRPDVHRKPDLLA